MSPDNKTFRRKLIGGFNRGDVIKYIESLAGERNDYKSRCAERDAQLEKIQNEYAELSDTVDSLRRELDEAQNRADEYKLSVLDSTEKAVDELFEQYNIVRYDMDGAVARINSELSKVSETLSKMSEILDKGTSSIQVMSDYIDSEKISILSESKPIKLSNEIDAEDNDGTEGI